ncbi:MAG: hypothetical protein AAGC60_04480 [Acidobacteriota bacterium]
MSRLLPSSRTTVRCCRLVFVSLAVLACVAMPASAHESHAGDTHTSHAAVPPDAEIWAVEGAVTSFSFDPVQLADFGLSLEAVRTSGAIDHHVLSVARGDDLAFAAVAPLSLGLAVDDGVLLGFTSGGLQHQGGFHVAWDGLTEGKASLDGFVLRPAQRGTSTDPRAVEILGADGAVLFLADMMHYALAVSDSGLDVFNADLRIAPELARRMGEPLLAGTSLGVLSMHASVVWPGTRPATAADGATPIAGNPPPCNDFDTGDVDVGLTAIGSVSQSVRQGGFVGVTPSARLKNVGTANVPWYSKFTGPFPPYNNDQHPFLVWALYRLVDGQVHQLGISDVKHAFLTLNISCDPGACTDSHILGLGCEDVYSEGTNNSYNSLSFRDEVESNLGLWEATGSHFDQNSDGSQDHPNSNPDSGTDHRMLAAEADLDTPGADYYIEAWYVVREDINIFNSMGRERVTPSQSGSGNWSFSVAGGSFEQGPVLDLWVDPIAPPAGTANSKHDTGQGWVQVAVRTTDLGGGLWRYEYALMNHDFDRKVASVQIPHGGGIVAFDYSFRDVDQDTANDWIPTLDGTAVTFTAPNADAALDWGTMLNVGFTADAAPLERSIVVGASELDSINSFLLTSQAPGPGSGALVFIDGFETGSTGAWSSTSP